MKEISNYIIEKLKINKDSKFTNEIIDNCQEGDNILCVRYDHRLSATQSGLFLYECKFISLDKNILSFKKSNNVFKKEVSKNSNGFYEYYKGGNPKTEIFLTGKDALNFLNVYDKKDTDTLLKFFDQEDEFILDKNVVYKNNKEKIEYLSNLFR